MKTIICSTCGCSLVRLGISKDEANTSHYDDKELYFCCQGCVGLFVTDPEKYIKETSDLVVCPTCLAEKPCQWATKLNVGSQDVYFCRCPHCLNHFQKDPDFYMSRLEGNISNEGVLGHDGCCIKPDEEHSLLFDQEPNIHRTLRHNGVSVLGKEKDMRNQFIILIVVALIFGFVLPIETAQDNPVDKLRKEIKSQYQEILDRQDTIIEAQNTILGKIEKLRTIVLSTR